MAHLVLFAHLPRLRIEGEEVEMGGGLLTKLPWDQYDGITLGAFADWRDRYEATEPVFFWTEIDLELPILRPGPPPQNMMAEMKIPRAAWDEMVPRLELGIVASFHERMVDPVWASLMLAAPAAAIAAPRASVTILGAIDDVHFAAAGLECAGVRIQGDVDQEYLFSPRTAGAPLDDEVLARAAALVDPVREALEGAELGPPLRQLLGTTEPVLSPGDRLTLSVAALEAMLLPEVRSGLGETFGRRLANLLGGETTEAVARDLYRARSASVHGTAAPSGASLPPACGEQFLAGSIVAAMTGSPGTPPTDDPPGRAPDERLLIAEPWWSVTTTFGVSLDPPEGTLMSWSPLVGLGYEGEPVGSRDLGAALMELTGEEVVSMEHKDVRRDFISQLAFQGVSVAGISVGAPATESLTLDRSQVAPLLRTRDLAALGLRLEGFDRFTDPQLFGWCVFEGKARHRNETVFRQSILVGMGREPAQTLTPERWAALGDAWRLLAAYEAGGAHAEIEAALGLFRQAHDRRFTPPQTRATLLLCLLESLLGRFRAKDDRVQLEHLVGALDGAGADAVDWFAAEGRGFRNAVAHGSWRPGPPAGDPGDDPEHLPLAHLLAIVRAGIRELLATWAAGTAHGRPAPRPSRLLIDAVAARAAA